MGFGQVGSCQPGIEDEFHSKCNWKPLESFKQKNDMILLFYSESFVGTWKAQKQKDELSGFCKTYEVIVACRRKTLVEVCFWISDLLSW